MHRAGRLSCDLTPAAYTDVIKFLATESFLALAAIAILALGLRLGAGRLPTARSVMDRISRERSGMTAGERWMWIAIVVIALADRLAHVRQTMRLDEALTFLLFASRPLEHALTQYDYPNNHLFHTLLVWISTRLLGTSPVAIRLPALITGMLLVPAVYAVARRFADRSTSLLAMALAAVWPELVLYSTNARGYSIIALVFLALIVLIDEGIADDAMWPWLTAGILIAIAMYTAPVAMYPAGAAMLWGVIEKARRNGLPAARSMLPRVLAGGALAVMLTLFLYVPVAWRSGLAPLISNRYVTPLTAARLVAAIPGFARDLVESLGLGIPRPLLLLLAVAGLAGVAGPGSDRPRRVRLALTTVLWSIAVLVATRRPPPARVWLFMVPLGCVYVAIGTRLAADWLSRARAWDPALVTRALAVALMTVIGVQTARARPVFRSPETGTLVDGPQIADYLLATMRPGDEIAVVNPCIPTLDYYLLRKSGRRLGDINAQAARQRLFVVVNPRHLQTLDSVKAIKRDLPWTELVPDGPPVSFAPESVFVFRYASGG
jgi:hypothetical protein